MPRLVKARQNLVPWWDEQDLVRRVCHALDIACLAVEHLAPHGFTDTGKTSCAVRREKIIAETSVLLHAAAQVRDHPGVGERIQRVATALAPHARCAEIRLGLALHPALAFDYSMAHVVLTSLGFPDPEFDALLRHSRASQAHAGRERTPHRALEQVWISHLWAARPDHPLRSVDGHARRSILAMPMDLFSASDEDFYAFTHAVMYATRFGRTPASLPRSRVAILAEAEAALARFLDAQDYDLAGEILLTWPFTGSPWSPAAAFAFRVLAEVEEKAGFLPTPATRISELKTRQGPDRMLYLLATTYHTAYVMGLLCAASLKPGCAPPARVPDRSMVHHRTERVLPLLGIEQPAPHWRAIAETLDPPQAEALASMLFHVALHRSVAIRDFAGLGQVLSCGDALGMTGTPAASQAAEMLERLARCVQPMGSPAG